MRLLILISRTMFLLLFVCAASTLVALAVGQETSAYVVMVVVRPLGYRPPEVRLADTSRGLAVTQPVTQNKTTFDATVPANTIPAWSPSGRQMVLIGETGFYFRDLSAQTFQTVTANPVSFVGWSPDDRHVAFISQGDIHVFDAYTGDLRDFTQDDYEALNLAWSPDGHCVAYHRREAAGAYALRVAGVDETVDCDLTLMLQNEGYSIIWSPDGEWLSFLSNPDGLEDAYTVHLPTGSLHQLTAHEPHTGVPQLIWSPSSTWIVMEIANGQGSSIHLTDPTGSETRLLAADATTPGWSPAGTYITYRSWRVGRGYSFYIVKPARVIEPIMTVDGRCEQLLWAEDENLLLFVHAQGSEERLVALSLPDGTMNYLSGPEEQVLTFAFQ